MKKIHLPPLSKIPVVNKEIKAIATLVDNGTKLKMVSQTDKGEEIRTYALSADGKELIMVSNSKISAHVLVLNPRRIFRNRN